jgi:hypothetical protein
MLFYSRSFFCCCLNFDFNVLPIKKDCEEPYCVIELDYPMQKHITEVVYNKDMGTINEQFLFDITQNSEELSFSIYDKAKDYGSKKK